MIHQFLNLSAWSSVSVDFSHRISRRDDALLADILKDYQFTLEQFGRFPRAYALSVQWADYAAELAKHLQPEFIHDFRRNRLCLYGLGRGILEEERGEVRLTLSENYSIAGGAVFSGEDPFPYALSVATQFHRMGRWIDGGLLANLSEDPVGGSITPVHQGRRLTYNLLRFAYFLTNVMRHTDLPRTGPVIVCELGGARGFREAL